MQYILGIDCRALAEDETAELAVALSGRPEIFSAELDLDNSPGSILLYAIETSADLRLPVIMVVHLAISHSPAVSAEASELYGMTRAVAWLAGIISEFSENRSGADDFRPIYRPHSKIIRLAKVRRKPPN